MTNRRSTTMAAALLVGATIGTDAVIACGDKFLVPGRGVRFQLKAAERQLARVVMLARPGTPLDGHLKQHSLATTLASAGYRTIVVMDEAALDTTLSGEGPWIVVVDLDGADTVAGRVATHDRAVILALATAAPKHVIKAAQSRHTRILRDPRSERAFVDALDSVVIATRRQRTARQTASE